MDERIPTWARLGLASLAVPQLVTGSWAVVAPQNWFERFPGLGPDVVAAEPPFNQHLATDAGAGFLAVGIALALAALWSRRRPAQLALAAFIASALPHVVYHAANPAPGLSDAENFTTTALLAGGIALAVVVTWATRSPAPDADETAPARGERIVTGR